MGLTLPNLYTTPNDIMDVVGTDQLQLCLDDENQATAQVVQVTADAAVGATSISVSAIQYGLLKGSVLEFQGAGMTARNEVTLTATAAAGATTLAVSALTAALNSGAQATDNGVNVSLANLALKGCRYATTKCKLYLGARYDNSALANNVTENGSVNLWATSVGAYWCRTRRGQAAPQPIKDSFDEALAEMKMVQQGKLNIEDIATRTSGWPFLSNVTVNIGYDVAKVRVEPAISEPTPTQYGQFVDWNSILILQY